MSRPRRSHSRRRRDGDRAGVRELDDLVLHLKGLVLVRKLRTHRGADAGELEMYRAEMSARAGG